MSWRGCAVCLALTATLAVGAAACGGGDSSAGTSGSQGTSATPSTIDVRSTDLGDVLVDASGRTLYLFEKDANGASSCSGECASNWPPVTVTGAPVAGGGLDSAKLGTTTRADGAAQVTYNGHPLYRFSGDAKAGETNGEGIDAFGSEWYAVSTSGDKIEKSSGGGGGYGGY